MFDGIHNPDDISARYDAGYPSDFNQTPPSCSASADAEIHSAGAQLRDWARFLARNSSIVKAVLDARCAKGVGTGLTYEPMVRNCEGQLLTKLNAAIKRQHDEWSKSVSTSGRLARQEVERIAWREWDTVGEIFHRKVYRGRTQRRLGYQLQQIRSELVPYGFINDRAPAMGIESDDWGAPSRYWVFPRPPASVSGLYGLQGLKAKPIDARFMSHLIRQEEIDSTRGLTLFHAVIFRASDIVEYQQSHRRAMRASANLFASINREPGMDTGDDSAPEGYDESRDQYQLNLQDLQILDYLKPGESLNFNTPSHPNQNSVEVINQELRQFAAACRVAFSWIAFVFDRAYAAQRTELIHAWEMIHEDRAQFVRDFAKPDLYDEPLRIALLENKLPPGELRRADPGTLYDCRIEGPVMPSIDPVKDRQGMKIDQEMGWESRPGNIRRLGRQPNQVDAERDQDSAAPMPETAKPAVAKAQQPDTDEQEEDNGQDD